MSLILAPVSLKYAHSQSTWFRVHIMDMKDEAYRPLKRFVLSFSLQSSQYHLAGEVSKFWEGNEGGRGTYHYP
jgi:hypothetical protein